MAPISSFRGYRTPRILNAVDSVRGAGQLAESIKQATGVWPQLPNGCHPVHVIGAVATPDEAATVTVVSYTVPSTFKFIWQGIVNFADAGAFTTGLATWTVFVNSPGVTDSQAMPVQGFIDLPVQLGSFNFGTEWPVPPGYEFASLDTLSVAATNVGLSVGGNNQFVSGLFGYLRPDTDQR